MTIVLGLLAKNGLVIAADTQETIPGYWKHDQGKIASCWRAGAARVQFLVAEPKRSDKALCMISGAGSAAQVDGITAILLNRFVGEPHLKAQDDVPPAFAAELESFHAKHVLPFAAYPREERPAFQLLIGYQYPGRPATLLTSEDNVFREEYSYAAVGVGASLAITLLGNWYQLPRLDVWQSAALAAYVLYLVKESIDGCGKHTDVAALVAGADIVRIKRKDTRALDGIFADYAHSVEPTLMRSLLSAPPPNGAMTLAKCRNRLRRIIDPYRSSATSSSTDQA